VTWILTTYLVANAVVLPMSAWFSRVYRPKELLLGMRGPVHSHVAALWSCAYAGHHAFQSRTAGYRRRWIGAGGTGRSSGYVSGGKRASTFALYTIVIITAPAIGPVRGGWITDNYSWRRIFFINVPVGIMALLLTSRFVQDPPAFEAERATVRRRGKLSADGIGIGLIALASGTL